VNEDVELSARQAHADIPHRQQGAGPGAALGKTQHQPAGGVVGSGADQAGHVRVATDHPVEDHDVGGLNLVGGVHKIHHPPLNAVGEAVLRDQLSSRPFIGGGELDRGGPAGAGAQQLQLDGADSTTHLEHGLPGHAFGNEQVDDAPGGGVEAPPAVTSSCGVRALLGKELAVSPGRATVAHAPNDIAPPTVDPPASWHPWRHEHGAPGGL